MHIVPHCRVGRDQSHNSNFSKDLLKLAARGNIIGETTFVCLRQNPVLFQRLFMGLILFGGTCAVSARAQDVEAIVAENEPAAVVIVGHRRDNGAEVQSSGCCIHPDGFVLTTAHQIAGVEGFTATFSDGSVQELEVLELNVPLEIALLKTKEPVKNFARLGNASHLRSGSALVAIATPLNMAFSAVSGIVSSANRTYNGYPVIQADLSASPGSSGGPVFDRYGNLVGLIIGKLREEDRVTVVNPVNNAYSILAKHGVLPAEMAQEDPALLRPTPAATSIERDAIDAYNAGVGAPDPAAKVRAYARAVELSPGFYQAWFNLGVAHGQLQEFAPAERAYRRAGSLNPEAVEVKRNLGRLLLRDRRPGEAAEVFEQAAELAPGKAQSYNDLGEAYRQLRRYEDAVKTFQQALSLDEGYAEVHYNLALTYLALDRKPEATEAFQRYLETNPRAEDAARVQAYMQELTKQTP